MWGLKEPAWYTINDFHPAPPGNEIRSRKFVLLEDYQALERAAQAFVDSQANPGTAK